MRIIIDIGLNNLSNTCGNVGILAQCWRNYLRKMSEFGEMLAQLLAENGAMLAQLWRNYLRKMSEFGARLAQLLAENVGIWRNVGAITCGKCRNLAQCWRNYLRKMSEFCAMLAPLIIAHIYQQLNLIIL